MTSTYTYEPLIAGKRQIRLLCIRPDKVRDDEILRCSMRTFSLGKSSEDSGTHHKASSETGSLNSKDPRQVLIVEDVVPDFFAISYVWGDATRRSSIIVDGVLLDVPESSEVALRNLSRHTLGMDRAYFWIDAICIDQANTNERSIQVTLMREIYSQAREALIWLGKDEFETADSAITSMLVLLDELRSHGQDPAHPGWCSFASDVAAVVNCAISEYCDIEAIDTFFTSGWFHRLWVIQEVVLSSSATCYCGSFSITWDDLGVAARCLSGSPIAEGNWGIFNAFYVWQLSSGKSIRLLHASRFEATEPRDKIYGLLGLAPHLAKVPDYKLSLNEIFTYAALAEIEHHDELVQVLNSAQVLSRPSCTQLATGILELPSWVPPYDRSRGDYSTLFLAHDNGGAAGTTNLHFKYTPKAFPTRLNVRGLLFDVVCATSASIISRSKGSPEIARNTFSDMWRVACDAFSKRPAEASSAQRAFATTLTVGFDRYSEVVSQHDNLHFAHYAAYMRGLQPDFNIPEASYMGMFEETDQGEPEAFKEAICENQEFFSTQAGFIGMVGRESRSGDSVCILFGCEAPVILRPKGDEWTFIGLAYVHDVMEGQVIQKLQAEGMLEERTQEFCIV